MDICPAVALEVTFCDVWPVTTGMKYKFKLTVAATLAYIYPVAGFGLEDHGPDVLVANCTVGLLIVLELRFQVLAEFATAVCAFEMPLVVPSSINAAASAAESQ